MPWRGLQPTRSAFHMCHFLLASAGGAWHGVVAGGARGLSGWHRRLRVAQSRHTCIHTHTPLFQCKQVWFGLKCRARVTQRGVWIHACGLINTVMQESSFSPRTLPPHAAVCRPWRINKWHSLYKSLAMSREKIGKSAYLEGTGPPLLCKNPVISPEIADAWRGILRLIDSDVTLSSSMRTSASTVRVYYLLIHFYRSKGLNVILKYGDGRGLWQRL